LGVGSNTEKHIKEGKVRVKKVAETILRETTIQKNQQKNK